MKRKISLLLVLLAYAGTSFALVPLEGTVTILEPTYLPGQVAFQLSTSTSICPAGTWLWWRKASADNNKAAYATLAAALVSGKRVRVYFVEGDTSCTVNNLHLL